MLIREWAHSCHCLCVVCMCILTAASNKMKISEVVTSSSAAQELLNAGQVVIQVMLVEKYLHGSFTLSLLHIPTAFSAAAACATSFSAAAEWPRSVLRAAAYGACAYTRAVTMDPILSIIVVPSCVCGPYPWGLLPCRR